MCFVVDDVWAVFSAPRAFTEDRRTHGGPIIVKEKRAKVLQKLEFFCLFWFFVM